MAGLSEFLIGVAAKLTGDQIAASAPDATRWLVDRAARRLPVKDRDRFREEWLSHAEELPGALAKLQHGLSCYLLGAGRIARHRNASASANRVRLIILIVESSVAGIMWGIQVLAGILRVGGIKAYFEFYSIVFRAVRLHLERTLKGTTNKNERAAFLLRAEEFEQKMTSKGMIWPRYPRIAALVTKEQLREPE